MVTRALVALAVVSVGAATTAACGARGPLDDLAFDDPSADASSADGSLVDTGTSSGEAGTTPGDGDDDDAGGDDATSPTKDAGRDGGKVDDSPIACGSCLISKCGQGLSACLQSQTCRDSLTCIATTCLSGGGMPDPVCAFGCANGDFAAIASILQLFTCVTSTCGQTCSSSFESILDLVGNLGDLRPDGGPPTNGGADAGDSGAQP